MEPWYQYKVKKQDMTLDHNQCKVNFLKEKGLDGMGGSITEMLRYEGAMVGGEDGDDLIIESPHLVEGRWRSFSIAPKDVKQFKLKAKEQQERYKINRAWQINTELELVKKCGWSYHGMFGSYTDLLYDLHVRNILPDYDIARLRDSYLQYTLWREHHPEGLPPPPPPEE